MCYIYVCARESNELTRDGGYRPVFVPILEPVSSCFVADAELGRRLTDFLKKKKRNKLLSHILFHFNPFIEMCLIK